MNAKKCKKLRASLRSKGVDPKNATYTMSHKNSGAVELRPSCGRFAYKRIKHLATAILGAKS